MCRKVCKHHNDKVLLTATGVPQRLVDAISARLASNSDSKSRPKDIHKPLLTALGMTPKLLQPQRLSSNSMCAPRADDALNIYPDRALDVDQASEVWSPPSRQRSALYVIP